MRFPNWFKQRPKKEVDHLNETVTIGSDIPPVSEVQAFKRDRIWKYIADTIDFRIKSARDDIEDQRMDLETIRVYQGRIEELRFIASLPDFIIENFTQLKAETEAKQKAEEEPTKQEVQSWAR